MPETNIMLYVNYISTLKNNKIQFNKEKMHAA